MTVLAAIVFLFVGFVLGVAVPRPRSREADALRDSLGEACQSLSEWIAKWNQANQVAQVERERKTLVEGQCSRLARLLRQYDRCECGLERREHQPGGIALASWRCDGFRLKTPADPLETTVAVDPPVSVSEIAEGSVMPSEELHRLAKLSEAVSTASLLGTDVILSGPGYRRIVDVEGLTPEESQAKVQAELDDIEAWLDQVNAENRDEPPTECEFALPSHVTVEHPDGSSEVMTFEEANEKYQVAAVPR